MNYFQPLLRSIHLHVSTGTEFVLSSRSLRSRTVKRAILSFNISKKRYFLLPLDIFYKCAKYAIFRQLGYEIIQLENTTLTHSFLWEVHNKHSQ